MKMGGALRMGETSSGTCTARPKPKRRPGRAPRIEVLPEVLPYSDPLPTLFFAPTR
jgi:hypothetical protein